MTIVPNTARATKRWKLLKGTDEFQGHTSSIEVTPTIVSWQGGDGNSVVDDDGCTVAIVMAQDTENPLSLWSVMRTGAGEKATLVINPHHDGTFEESVDVTLVRPPLRMARGGAIPEVTVNLTGVYTPPAPVTP